MRIQIATRLSFFVSKRDSNNTSQTEKNAKSVIQVQCVVDEEVALPLENDDFCWILLKHEQNKR